jgi:hypothetical protein
MGLRITSNDELLLLEMLNFQVQQSLNSKMVYDPVTLITDYEFIYWDN